MGFPLDTLLDDTKAGASAPAFGNLPRSLDGGYVDAAAGRGMRDEGRESKVASACLYPAMQNVELRSWEEICNAHCFYSRPTAA